MKEIEKNHNSETFEEIKHIDENGIEFWYARELQKVLDYTEWRKFENVIQKAITACENSGINGFEHFVDTDKLSKRANENKISQFSIDIVNSITNFYTSN
jgi:DNA-damage-inducible protein D